jgi:two-component system nitrogen regulation sensor histidine kinase NtrY
MKRQLANKQVTAMLVVCIPAILIAIGSLAYLSISIYLLLFFSLVLLLLLVFVLASVKEQESQQIKLLSNLVEALIEGDYSLRGNEQRDPAFQYLLEMINRLADSLHQHSLKIEENQLLINKIINRMHALVFCVDNLGYVKLANRAAKQVFQELVRKGGAAEDGIEISALEQECGILFQDTHLGFLVGLDNDSAVNINTAGLVGEYQLFKDHFIRDGSQQTLFLLTKADNMLRQKEQQAWQGLLRVFSHELNNSLTPIATISRSMKRELKQGSSKVLNSTYLEDGLSIINERAESLKSFIASYRALSYLPPPNLSVFELGALLKRICQLFPVCQFDLSQRLLSQCYPLHIQGDLGQIEQVLINLIKNAEEASVERLASDKNVIEENRVLIQIDGQCRQSAVDVFIRDEGIGIANPENLFVPMYTTKKGGSGIGLSLSRQIIHNHGGQLNLRNREDIQGAEARITLPLTETFD